MSIINCKINISKIPKETYFKGKKGVYLSFSVSEKRTPGQYGDTHSVYLYDADSKEKTYIGDGKKLDFENAPEDHELPPGFDDIEDAVVIPEGKTPF